jgi:hypothetical protein
MIAEASVPGPAGRERSAASDVVITPDAVHPTLEMVLFQDPGPMPHDASPCDEAFQPTPDEAAPNRSPAAVAAAEASFVNATRGASPSMLETGVIPISPVSFRAKVAKHLPSPVAPSPLSHHCARRTMLTSVPRRSARLARKAMGRTPAVAAAQNILRKKLGLAEGPQLQYTDFERYLKLFVEGLSDAQVELIKELFANVTPGSEALGQALEDA